MGIPNIRQTPTCFDSQHSRRIAIFLKNVFEKFHLIIEQLEKKKESVVKVAFVYFRSEVTEINCTSQSAIFMPFFKQSFPIILCFSHFVSQPHQSAIDFEFFKKFDLFFFENHHTELNSHFFIIFATFWSPSAIFGSAVTNVGIFGFLALLIRNNTWIPIPMLQIHHCKFGLRDSKFWLALRAQIMTAAHFLQ